MVPLRDQGARESRARNDLMRSVYTRVMLDGTFVKGAQGNFPFERAAALTVNRFKIEQAHGFELSFFGAPWIQRDPLGEIQQMSLEKLAELHSAIPPGVIADMARIPCSRHGCG